MIVLDSGAEVSVVNQLSLIPRPFDIPLPVVSFNGSESSCKKTGEAIGGVKDTKGNFGLSIWGLQDTWMEIRVTIWLLSQ